VHEVYGNRLALVKSGVSKSYATITRVGIEFDDNGSVLGIVDEEEAVLDAQYKPWDQDVLDTINERGEAAVEKFSETVVVSKIDVYGDRGGRDVDFSMNCDVINGCRAFDCPIGRLVTSMMMAFCEEAGYVCASEASAKEVLPFHPARSAPPAPFYPLPLCRYPCDIAATNGGGLRDGFESGDVALNDVGKVLPFSNMLEIREVTGAGIRGYIQGIPLEYVNYNATNLEDCHHDGGFLQAAGLKCVAREAMAKIKI
jgi:2',3'-cyclic-nucleotide 2'-phosphodiesterase (5'-nucleotidase family)